MNLFEHYRQGPLVLPKEIMRHFGALFEKTDDFVIWLSIYSQADISPSRIAEEVGMPLATVNKLLTQLKKQGLLEISFDGQNMTFDTSPLFQRLDGLLDDQDSSQVNHGQQVPGNLGGLVEQFEAEMGVLSPFNLQEIQKWVMEDHYAPDMISLALKEAVLSGKVTLNYIRGILNNWQQEGIKTSQAAERANRQFQTRKTQASEDFHIPLTQWLGEGDDQQG